MKRESKGRVTYHAIRRIGETSPDSSLAFNQRELNELKLLADSINKLAETGRFLPVELVRVEVTPV